MDGNAAITLEALEDHPDFGFNLNVVALNGTATRESSHRGLGGIEGICYSQSEC